MAKSKPENAEKVMSVVEKELGKNPDATVDHLYDKAKAADPGVEKLTKRQFNARYPLQVKRRKSGTKPKKSKRSTAKKKKSTSKRKKAAPAGEGREAVRATFMKFATDMAAAEARKDLVQFLARVDTYVDDVLEATSS